MKNKETKIKKDTFKETLDTIVPGWTIGVCVLTIPLLLLAAPAVFFLDTNTTKDKIAFLSTFILFPLIAFFQSLLISLVCYLGLKVYNWNKRRKSL